MLCTKNAALQTFRDLGAMVKTQYGMTIKKWMSDAGGEYKSKEFDNFLQSNGIEILTSAPHTLQQNSHAERFMHTVLDKAEAMRHDACCLSSYWGFVINHATHVYNRTPLWRHKWVTPYEVLNNMRPDCSHLRIFGCGAYVHLPNAKRDNKLAAKSEQMMYISTSPDNLNNWLFIRDSGAVFTSLHAIFKEHFFLQCDKRTTRHHPLTDAHSHEFPTGHPPAPFQPDDHRRNPPAEDAEKDDPADENPNVDNLFHSAQSTP
jgi:transposase InsO family protein